MADPSRPVFLVRESYRRRRLADAAHFVPVFGLVLLLLPALWATDNRTADAVIYVFSVWMVLILLTGWLSRRLSDDGDKDGRDESRTADR